MNTKIKEFYKATKLDSAELAKRPKLLEAQWPEEWKKIFYKSYPRFPSKKLILPKNPPAISLVDALNNRKSHRDFSDKPMPYDILSALIYYSFGIKDGSVDFNNSRRTYPSPGARYSIENYVIANNVENLEKGLYHFNVKNNCLELLLEGELEFNPSSPKETGFNNLPSVAFILTAMMPRIEVKYGTNAYRLVLLEAGHIGQNISLLAEAYNVGCCAIGGFDNDKISKLLDICDDELPVYMLNLGKKDKE